MLCCWPVCGKLLQIFLTYLNLQGPFQHLALKRLFPTRCAMAQVGPTTGLLACGVHDHLSFWCAHDPCQLSLIRLLVANDTGALGNVPGA